MPRTIRRSIFGVPLAYALSAKWMHSIRADVLVLDLEEAMLEKDFSRSQMAKAIFNARQSGADVFVRLSEQSIEADLEAAVLPGLTGVIVPRVQNADEIHDVSEHLTKLEGICGIRRGSLEINAEIGTAIGIWNSLDIAQSSRRLTGLIVGETSLYQDLHLDPEATFTEDPLWLIKAQIIINARAASIQAYGMSYPVSVTLEESDKTRLCKAVRRARDMGFKGAICPYESWVEICNSGFRPSKEELLYYKKVREVFTEGLCRGVASIRLEGRMIDTPVDIRARAFLAWGTLCDLRDARKKKGD